MNFAQFLSTSEQVFTPLNAIFAILIGTVIYLIADLIGKKYGSEAYNKRLEYSQKSQEGKRK